MNHSIRWLFTGAVVLLSSGCTYARIGDGELGVVRTPTGMSPNALQTGDWAIGANDMVAVYNTRSQQRDERLEVLAANGLKIVLDTSVRYHIIPNDVLKLDAQLGREYYNVLLGPTLMSQARRVVGRYQPEEIYSTQREQIEKQILEGISAAVAGRHLEVEAVLIRNVQLPDVIQAAINNKLEAEQTALKMKFVIAEAQAQSEKALLEKKAQVERDRLAADGEAAAVRVEAEGKADAKRIEGQAMADYQRSLKQNLTPEVLRYYQIDANRSIATAPNSKFVFALGASAPQTLLDMRDGAVAVPPGSPPK
jgi:regulator of protease activity HflC (stomatin/prohibitin superfamily)